MKNPHRFFDWWFDHVVMFFLTIGEGRALPLRVLVFVGHFVVAVPLLIVGMPMLFYGFFAEMWTDIRDGTA